MCARSATWCMQSLCGTSPRCSCLEVGQVKVAAASSTCKGACHAQACGYPQADPCLCLDQRLAADTGFLPLCSFPQRMSCCRATLSQQRCTCGTRLNATGLPPSNSMTCTTNPTQHSSPPLHQAQKPPVVSVSAALQTAMQSCLWAAGLASVLRLQGQQHQVEVEAQTTPQSPVLSSSPCTRAACRSRRCRSLQRQGWHPRHQQQALTPPCPSHSVAHILQGQRTLRSPVVQTCPPHRWQSGGAMMQRAGVHGRADGQLEGGCQTTL